MARPRHLPEFNPWVPDIIRDKYTTLFDRALECVRKTQAGDKFASLAWLKLYDRLLKLTQKFKMIESPKKIVHTLSTEEQAALRWAYHKGKWNWDETQSRSNQQQQQDAGRVKCQKEKRKEGRKVSARARVAKRTVQER